MHVYGVHFDPNLQLGQRLSPQQEAAEKKAAEVRRKLRFASEDDADIADEYVPGHQEGGDQEDGDQRGGPQQQEPEENASQKEAKPDSESEDGSLSSWA